MPSLDVVRHANESFSPSYIPVAVFIGGTAGIGRAMAETFARYTKGRAHIIIVGRNSTAGHSIIASFPKPGEAGEWKHEFRECDVTLMKNVQDLTAHLTSDYPKINFLVLSAGVFSLRGKEETSEGIDKKLASRYYSRWAAIDGLLPSLLRASKAGEDGRVMSILGAGHGPNIDVDDIGLTKRFSGLRAMSQSISYNDFMLAEYARKHPEIAFTHIYPGLVDTAALLKITRWPFMIFYPLSRLITLAFAISPDECAEYMLHAILDGEKGFIQRSPRGDVIQGFVPSEDAQRKLWEHTLQTVTRARVVT